MGDTFDAGGGLDMIGAPTPSFTFYFEGRASVPLPIPGNPALHGAEFFPQGGVVDPPGAFGGGSQILALSLGRTVIVW